MSEDLKAILVNASLWVALFVGAGLMALLIKKSASFENERLRTASTLSVTGLFIFYVVYLPQLIEGIFGKDIEAPLRVVATILGVVIPMLYIDFTRDTNRVLEETKKTRTIVERSGDLRNTIPELLEIVLSRLATSRTEIAAALAGTVEGKDTSQRKSCVTIFGVGFDDLCRQTTSVDFYLRRGQFEPIWDELTRNPRYDSVCDLSPYSRLRLAAGSFFDDYYDSLQASWENRIHREIDTLVQFKGTFQKLIVYSPPINDQRTEDPPCVSRGQCDFRHCPEDKCIVKPIATLWEGAAPRLKANRPPPSNSHSIWLTKREGIQRSIRIHNGEHQYDGGKLTVGTIDLGIFGEKFFGEEFKVPVELDYGHHVMKDYLYRIRHDPELVRLIRRLFEKAVHNGAVGVA